MREIVLYPDKKLRGKTPLVGMVDDQLLGDIRELREILEAQKDRAAGLAAPQIGIGKRFFGLVRFGKKRLTIFINPKIEKVYGIRVRPMMQFDKGKTEVFLEGCLSFPNLFGVVKRYLKIEVSWQEVRGKKLIAKTETLEGIEAIAYQHESEHLDGMLLIDHIKNEGGEWYLYQGEGRKEVRYKDVVREE